MQTLPAPVRVSLGSPHLLHRAPCGTGLVGPALRSWLILRYAWLEWPQAFVRRKEEEMSDFVTGWTECAEDGREAAGVGLLGRSPSSPHYEYPPVRPSALWGTGAKLKEWGHVKALYDAVPLGVVGRILRSSLSPGGDIAREAEEGGQNEGRGMEHDVTESR